MIDPLRCSIESISQARCGFSNHFSIVTRDTDGNVCSIATRALIHVKILDIDGNDVDTEFTESENAGRYIVKYKAQKPSPYKVVVSIGGTSIKGSPQDVETIDAKAELEPVRVFETTSRAPHPLSLAVSDTGEVAVVHNQLRKEPCRVVLLSADGEYLREFGGGGTRESRLIDPWGVAFNGDQLLVSDNQGDGGCIKEFDIHGNYKRTICEEKGLRFERMCTTEQSIACLTYNKHSKEAFIKLVSKQTGPTGIRDHRDLVKLDIGDVGPPLFLAYDNNKYFVSFNIIHSIYVFDENGGFLYTFEEKGNNGGQFNCPRGLAVFGADLLLVCDGINQRVQLLNQDGEFIRSFGSPGSGLDHMKGPYDVVVTPDGQVFVLGLGDNRVNCVLQVFR